MTSGRLVATSSRSGTADAVLTITMTTTNPTNPRRLHDQMIRVELDGSVAPDIRRWFRDERMILGLALRAGNAARIAAARDEALRCARMWLPGRFS